MTTVNLIALLLGMTMTIPSVGTAHAGDSDWSGTWRGTLAGGGETFEVEQTFSQSGYVVFTYTNNTGRTRSVELASDGQQVQYVPPGGGVKTLVVESVVKQPERLSYFIKNSFERSSGGYLDQQYFSEEIDFALIPQGLRMRLVTRSQTYFGDRDGSTGGPSESIAEGILGKVE